MNPAEILGGAPWWIEGSTVSNTEILRGRPWWFEPSYTPPVAGAEVLGGAPWWREARRTLDTEFLRGAPWWREIRSLQAEITWSGNRTSGVPSGHGTLNSDRFFIGGYDYFTIDWSATCTGGNGFYGFFGVLGSSDGINYFAIPGYSALVAIGSPGTQTGTFANIPIGSYTYAKLAWESNVYDTGHIGPASYSELLAPGAEFLGGQPWWREAVPYIPTPPHPMPASLVPSNGPVTGGTSFILTSTGFNTLTDPLTEYTQPGSGISNQYQQNTSGTGAITANSSGVVFHVLAPGDLAGLQFRNGLNDVDASISYASTYPTTSNIHLNYDITVAALRLTSALNSSTYFEVSHHIHTGSYIQILSVSGGQQLDVHTYTIAIPTQQLRILRVGARCQVFVGNTLLLDYPGWSSDQIRVTFDSSAGTGPSAISAFTTTFTNLLLNAVVLFGTEPAQGVVVVTNQRIRGATPPVTAAGAVPVNYFGFDGSRATATTEFLYTAVESFLMLETPSAQLSLSGDDAIFNPIPGQPGLGNS